MKIIYENSDSEHVVETRFTEEELRAMLSYEYLSKALQIDEEDFCFGFRQETEEDLEPKKVKKKRKA